MISLSSEEILDVCEGLTHGVYINGFECAWEVDQ